MKISMASLARGRMAAAATVTAAGAGLLLGGCGSPGSAPAAVPSLGQSAGAVQAAGTSGNGGPGAPRASALHAAAQCIRQHGIPAYHDPVLTPGGQVYTDARPIQDTSQPTMAAVQQACRALLTQANLTPDAEPPAPPQLVQAGVRGAECLRAHGMPNVQDPTVQTPYTPGHGFGMTASQFPSGGKASPVYQQAAHACRPLLDAEIRASTLASLGNDG
ncbi:MAG: hypothetical protein JOY82_25445 [Streptosporangiaceae bacterium]|nr:hypothetical protein [Streptosporangiaceae bacterium]MBV9857833.1 hypothetical protein [Streptosporangiaceae bacterium]